MMSERVQHQDFFAPAPILSGVLQRKCGCGNHTVAGGECSECSKKKNGLQRKLAIGPGNDSYEQEADRIADQVLAAPAQRAVRGGPTHIQRYARNEPGNADTAPDSVDHVLARSGRPLDPGLRIDMEQRFGHDFSRVRVHSDTAAAQSARELNALAYTVEHNIVFGSGQFNPDAHQGRRLLAHELTHVVQQTGPGALSSGPATGQQTSAPRTVQRAPIKPGEHGSTLPHREATNLLECIRIMGEQNAAYCRREVLGEEEPTSTPFVPPATSGGTPLSTGSGKTARILRMEKARDCAFTVTYSNVRQVDCDTAWKKEKGTAPPGPLCGASLVYDIVSVTATGSKCPATLDGLTLKENVKTDHGCTPPSHKYKEGSCTIGPGGKISGCTDTFTLCGLTSDLKGSCTEILDQEIEIGGQLAEEHEITFDLKKSATSCTGKVTRN